MSKLNNFSDVFPPRNLGPGDPWARHSEDRILGLEREVRILAQVRDNDISVMSARAELTADQIAILSGQQKVMPLQQDELSSHQGLLEAQQDILSQQQSLLEAQQDTLSDLQTQLDVLVNSTPVTSTVSGDISGFSIPEDTRNQITLTVPVPAGKTRASVFAIGQAFFLSGEVPPYDIASWRVQIQGDNGNYGFNVPVNMDGESVSFSHSRDFDVGGLSSFTVIAQSVTGTTHPTEPENRADLRATVTFSI